MAGIVEFRFRQRRYFLLGILLFSASSRFFSELSRAMDVYIRALDTSRTGQYSVCTYLATQPQVHIYLVSLHWSDGARFGQAARCCMLHAACLSERTYIVCQAAQPPRIS